jgi:hypothetical protein
MKLRLIVLWAALALTCFAKPVPQGFSQAGKQTIQSWFFGRGIPSESLIVPDGAYALPSHDWLQEFCGKLRAEQTRRGLDHYTSPENNCNKFTRFAAAYAAECWYKDPARINGKALAFGQVFYYYSKLHGHAINCAIVRDHGKLDLVFIEPQDCTFTTLTPNEIRAGVFMF